MNKNEDMDFVFGSHGEDNQLRDEAVHGDIDRLSHRITLFAIIMPCIIGIILVFGYFDIKGRMDQVSDTGTKEVESISRDVESMISQLQVRHAKLEKNLDKRVAEINQSISSIKKKIRKAEKNIDFLAASKESKKAVRPKVKELKSSLASLGEDLQAVSARADALKTELAQSQIKLAQSRKKFEDRVENRLEDEMARKGSLIAENLQKIGELEKAVALARENGIDTKALNLALKKERDTYKAKLDRLKADLKKEIDLLKFAAPEKSEEKTAPSNGIVEQDITN